MPCSYAYAYDCAYGVPGPGLGVSLYVAHIAPYSAIRPGPRRR